MIKLKRLDGSITPFRNSRYIPFYYLVPKSVLKRCGAELCSIPRNPRFLFANRAMCDLIESDLFKLFVIDVTAYLVWPYMGFREYMEIYSGYDPIWKIAHNPNIWINTMTEEGILPTAEDFYRNTFETLGYVKEEELHIILKYIVPKAMEKYNLSSAVETVKNFRCFEDFDFRNSRQKTDFYRKWYHTRTNHPIISLEEYKDNYAQRHNGIEWDKADTSQEFEDYVDSQMLVDKFKSTLSEKDMQILTMRMDGYTLEEIAKTLGYKNHSGILKRIRKIGLAYQKFTGVDYGFQDKKII